jgi:predicted nucleic acid-binding Zn ribbon protein
MEKMLVVTSLYCDHCAVGVPEEDEVLCNDCKEKMLAKKRKHQYEIYAEAGGDMDCPEPYEAYKTIVSAYSKADACLEWARQNFNSIDGIACDGRNEIYTHYGRILRVRKVE